MPATVAPNSAEGWFSQYGYAFDPGASAQNVLEAALDRIRTAFSLAEHVIVTWSGGKDSTTTLMLTLQVARELGRLPLTVCFADEEVIDPCTTEHAADVALWDELDFHWFCLPLRHTLKSKMRAHWTTWDPEQRDVWVREMPTGAIVSTGLRWDAPDLSYDAIDKRFYRDKLGWNSIIVLAGIRIQEAFNRRRAILNSGGWLVERQPGYLYAKPIYDWRVEDVWRGITKFNWPHSKHYDYLTKAGVPLVRQRVAVWGNVASARELTFFAEFYPEFFEKACRRLPELRPMHRYGDSSLYRQATDKPTHLTWQEYAYELLAQLDPADQPYWHDFIKHYLGRWASFSSLPFPDETNQIDDGKRGGSPAYPSWKQMAFAIQKNDRINGSSRDSL